MEQIARGENDRLLINMPPGSAKSTYASVLFPAWLLAQQPDFSVIGASHTADLAQAFSRRAMGMVREHSETLGISLVKEAVVDWTTSNGGCYKSAGVGGPITGRRADVTIIDDPVKPLAADTPIPTPNGWTTMGELRIGDQVFDHAGNPCSVVNVTPRYNAHRHRVWFSDKSYIDAHPDHLWMAFDRISHAVFNNGSGGVRRRAYVPDWWTWSTRKGASGSCVKRVTTREISGSLFARGTIRNWTIPTAFPLNLPDRTLPIDPYILGYWLGAGDKRDPCFTVHENDADSFLGRVATAGYVPKNMVLFNNGTTYRISVSTTHTRENHRDHTDCLIGRLQRLGVQNNKHIPAEYLRASYQQRLDLLRGLLDSCATIEPNGCECVFATTDKLLADGISELICSMGGKFSTRSRTAAKKTTYIIRFSPPFQPFSLPRKAKQYRPEGKIRHVNRTIVDVEVLEETEHLCITVDADSHLFLAGRSMIPTCNSREDADSESYRERAWEWFTADLRTRLKPGGRIVLIMTRWHEDDLGGRILLQQSGRWRTLKLPAIAGEDDPLGRAPGDWLWDDDDYGYASELRKVYGEYQDSGAMRDWGALFQQDPRPSDGGVFKTHLISTMTATPAGNHVVRAWDLAATEQTGTRDPDWTAGVKMLRTQEGGFVVLDVVRFRGGPDDVERAIVNTAALDGHHCRIGIAQDPGQAGKQQVLYLTRKLTGYRVESSPETGDKSTRAAPVASQVNVGNVSMVKAAWNAPFINELTAFPSGTKDDMVDAMSRAFSMVGLRPPPIRIDPEFLRRV